MTGEQEAAEAAEDADFFRRYGPWEPFTLTEARALLDPIGIPWWIAGGQAAEAFHGVPRDHEDIDISMFRSDVSALRAALDGRLDLWSAGPSGLRPVVDKWPEPADDADQIWLRAHALAPWRADVVLTRDRDGLWASRRDPELVAPLADVTFVRAGIRFLKPEIVLSFKARQRRTKDEHDFTHAAPLLDDTARTYLVTYLATHEPDHPWRDRL